MLDLGGFARFFTCLFMVITVFTTLFLHRYARARGFEGDELYGLLLFAALGMVLVAGALNWVIFFLGLELLSLALYVLIAVRKGEAAGNEAGLKYFMVSAVASAFLTFGIALLYAMSGDLSVAGSLAAALAYPDHLPVILLALALILVGIGFKISRRPSTSGPPTSTRGPGPGDGVSVHRFQGGPGCGAAALFPIGGPAGVGLLPVGALGPGGPHHGGGQRHRPVSDQGQAPPGLLFHRPDGLSLYDAPGRLPP